MILTNHHHFFKNKEIDTLYITISLISFAEGLISIFVPIYFWQLGYPVWKILFYYFLNAGYFVIFSLTFLPLFRKLSDKMMIFLSIPFTVAYYSLLSLIGSVHWLFYFLPALVAFSGIFFNIGYHMDFSCSSDKKDVCKQVGLQYTISSIFQFIAPFLGGLIIFMKGFTNTFILASLILIAAVIPLLFFPKRKIFNLKIKRREIVALIFDKNYRKINISGFGYANEASIATILWELYVFVTFGSIKILGLINSIMLLISAFVTYIIGYFGDKGRDKSIIRLFTPLLSLNWFLRGLLSGKIFVVTSFATNSLIYNSVIVTWSGLYYKITKTFQEPGIFVFAFEILFNLSRVIFLPILMLLSWAFPPEIFFPISFIVAGVFASTYLVSADQKLKTHKQKEAAIIAS